MKYVPSLDGVRAFSAIAVVLFHAGVPGFGGAFIGVDVFFVLSGYLITRVLNENPDLRGFYWRRAKRLIPPLALLLVVYALVAPWLAPGYPHLRDSALAFAYLSDYSVAFWEAPKYLKHTWSLSVEEHFYLLWPVIFLRLRPTLRALAIAYVIATAWRWGWTDWHQSYHRFDTHLSGLILGCLLATAPALRISAWPGMIGLGALVVLLRFNDSAQGLGILAAEVCAAVLVIGRKPEWLGTPLLAYLGKLSYGIYLWHYPIVWIMRETHQPWPVTAGVSLLASIALAAISYHSIESWFRASKRTLVGAQASTA